MTPQQEEIVRYVNDSEREKKKEQRAGWSSKRFQDTFLKEIIISPPEWTAVEKELERAKQGGACKVTVYQEAEPNPKLRGEGREGRNAKR